VARFTVLIPAENQSEKTALTSYEVVQLLAPLGLFTPALQKTQEAAPAEPENFPEGHNSQ
jgi:hypothetical protein